MSNLSKALSELRNPEKAIREKNFPIETKTFLQKRKESLKRADQRKAKKLINRKNTWSLIKSLPSENEILHVVTCGDFIMGDFVFVMVDILGPPKEIIISSLSISLKNIESLVKILNKHKVLKFSLVLSHYFQCKNKEIFRAVETQLIEQFPDRVDIGIIRTHCKIFLMNYPNDHYVIETSANLRSSNNLEQMTIFNDLSLSNFHQNWIKEALALYKKHE